MNAEEVVEWLAKVRKQKPGITDIDIGRAIGRSDQWILNAKTKGVDKFSSFALRWYLFTLVTVGAP